MVNAYQVRAKMRGVNRICKGNRMKGGGFIIIVVHPPHRSSSCTRVLIIFTSINTLQELFYIICQILGSIPVQDSSLVQFRTADSDGCRNSIDDDVGASSLDIHFCSRPAVFFDS
jgi:hypothetical protein